MRNARTFGALSSYALQLELRRVRMFCVLACGVIAWFALGPVLAAKSPKAEA